MEIVRRKTVGVMGSGRESHTHLANVVGRIIAETGCNLLTGGGQGVMASVAKAFVSVSERSGISIGIVPTETFDDATFLPKQGYPNRCVELPILTPLGTFDGGDFSTPNRNHVNILSSDCVIFLPGSRGTENEVMIARAYGKRRIFFGEPNFKLEAAEYAALDADDLRAFLKG